MTLRAEPLPAARLELFPGYMAANLEAGAGERRTVA